MDIEQALLVVDAALENIYLSNVQELVLRQSWEGKTYPEIAESYGYEANYIKNVGYKLWSLLSQAFAEEVTKSNFRSVIRRHSPRILAKQCSTVAVNNNKLKDRQACNSKLLHNNTDDLASHQQSVAIDIIKQCSECSLTVLPTPSKSCPISNTEYRSARKASEGDNVSIHQVKTKRYAQFMNC
ncbi:hypothetical protein [Chroococcidiopsis sp. TS-821]|uniref:hypothetical protein n=1 Tax=Chroococcidiopsis sp. TS-821 TaxID=1378066 RepID=UPI000D410046|nr:hypothetical protein [Chroococcidiopsis sp. TS-821]PPS40656.1 hypothetical protein B1A85_19455 [Chroococcidiopsis sp. TS-821]